MHRVLLGTVIAAVLAGSGTAQTKPSPVAPGSADSQVDPKTAARLKALEDAKAQPAPMPTTSRLDMRKLNTGNNPAPAPRTGSISPEDANLSPEEIRAKYKDRLGRAYVDYRTNCEPAVLAPGEQGKIVVFFVLKGDAVMPPSGARPVDLQAVQGDLELGALQFQPATPCKVAAAFRGKAAYDDYALAEIPVSVAATARPGLQTVHLTFDYELYNGTTAGWIEKFRDHVTADVMVGKPAAPAAAVAPPAVAPAVAAGKAAADLPSTGAVLPAGAEGPDAATGGDAAAGLDTEGSTLVWVFGAAGAVLGAAVLLRLRRRS